MSVVKVRKVGGSLVVHIPKEVAETEGIREGELVRIEVQKAKRSWFGAARGIGPFTVEDELQAHD
jgi:antitoxin component of MazEF toxin-antitoxin module